MPADTRTVTHRQLVRRLLLDVLLAAAVLAFVVPAAAHARTTVVNDPARPFTGPQLASMQAWLDRSAEPTPAVIRVHRGECPTAVACANVDYDPAAPKGARWFVSVGSIWLTGDVARRDRFAFMHEVGHVVDAETYAPRKRTRIERLLRMHGAWYPDARYWDGSTPPDERAADAYAMCSVHPHWPGTWWHWQRRLSNGTVVGGGNPTPYDFRAGRARYRRICRAIRAG